MGRVPTGPEDLPSREVRRGERLDAPRAGQPRASTRLGWRSSTTAPMPPRSMTTPRSEHPSVDRARPPRPAEAGGVPRSTWSPVSSARCRTSRSTSSDRTGGSRTCVTRVEVLRDREVRHLPRPRLRGREAPPPRQSAWFHLMPSLKEGWGLVVVEAGIPRDADRGLPRGRWSQRLDRARAGQGCSWTTVRTNSPTRCVILLVDDSKRSTDE